ncbi:MAG: biotin/lipoyl-containing protein, partial [Acidobacteriota bacterium]
MANFVMPKLGADMTAGKLLTWRKTVGDKIERGEVIAEIETDKSDIEVESFVTGIIEKILIQPG